MVHREKVEESNLNRNISTTFPFISVVVRLALEFRLSESIEL